MKISELRFYATLRGDSIYSNLPKSILPMEEGDKPANKDRFLRELFDDIRTGRYFPSLPRGYVISDKHNGVARIVPVFNYRDSCVYYLCVKEIEEHIAVNRVEGTYGGWQMGNPIRVQEEAESRPMAPGSKEATDDESDFGGYYITGSIDPTRWVKNYRSFQRHAYEWSRQENLRFFLECDVANFYDSINLDILERKIRAAVPREKYETVDLLFVFLRNWNREFEGYSSKSVGIPQDDMGDCSRMLTNFYLLDYDEVMHSICTKAVGCGRYLRYADDQIIMTENPVDARRILFRASMELHKIGLNINSGKVKEFSMREDFDYYWAFELFDLLGDKENIRDINQAAEQFVRYMKGSGKGVPHRPWRSESVQNRLINVGLNKLQSTTRREILRTVTFGRSIMRMDALTLERMYLALNKQEQEELIGAIELWIPEVYYNSFLLNVLRFYARCRKDAPVDHILQRLKELTNG